MTTQTERPTLADLEFLPYLTDGGILLTQLQGKVGVYAIFNQEQTLQYVGYSRDVYLGLKQHLVRQPQQCYWLKVQTIERPNRTLLEEIQNAWIAENGATPPGNGTDAPLWNQPIAVQGVMTADEQTNYSRAIDEIAQIKVLKQACRRVEAEVLEILKARGVQEEIRFNPKLKEVGLLDLK